MHLLLVIVAVLFSW